MTDVLKWTTRINPPNKSDGHVDSVGERQARVVVVGIEQMTINGVTRRQRQFQFILWGLCDSPRDAPSRRLVNSVTARRIPSYVQHHLFQYLKSLSSNLIPNEKTSRFSAECSIILLIFYLSLQFFKNLKIFL